MKIFTAFLILLFSSAPLLVRADDAAERSAAVEDLLKAMHADQMMKNVIEKQREAFTKMMPSMMPKDLPASAAKQAQDLQPRIMEIVYKQLTWESLKPDFIQIYSEVFTVEEIREITEFYRTPIGQKMIEKMPEVTTKSMQLMQKRMMAIMPEMQKAIAEATEQAKAAAKASASVTATPSPAAEQP